MKNVEDIAQINENVKEEVIEVNNIKNLIYNIRGKQVMLWNNFDKVWFNNTRYNLKIVILFATI